MGVHEATSLDFTGGTSKMGVTSKYIAFENLTADEVRHVEQATRADWEHLTTTLMSWFAAVPTIDILRRCFESRAQWSKK